MTPTNLAMSHKKLKRLHSDEESDDEPLSKYAKISHKICDSDDEPLIKYVKNKRIRFTEMNDDCLEQIFMHLNVMDLFNVTIATDDRIGNVARYVFSRKFAEEKYVIGDQCPRNEDDNYDQFICASKACAFLEEFGHFITYIEVGANLPNYNEIEKKISDICSQSLEDLAIIGHGPDSYDETLNVPFQFLQKPFENVECLALFDIFINSKVQLHKWFPKLRTLKYGSVYDGNGESIEQHFSNLKRVVIIDNFLGCSSDSNLPTQKNVIKMLELNPQIRDLQIEPIFLKNDSCERISIDCTLFHTVATKCPNLAHLSIMPLNVSVSDTIYRNIISFEDLDYYLEDAEIDNTPEALSATFENLTILNLYDCWIWNDDWTTFILRHKSLENLSIECAVFDNLPVNIEEIIFHSPNLKSLRASGCAVTIAQLDMILGENQTIEIVEVSKGYDDTADLTLDIDLFTSMNYSDKWDITDSYDEIRFYRIETLT